MPLATYTQPDDCNTCTPVQTPIFDAMHEATPSCPTGCGVNNVKPIFDSHIMPDGILWPVEYFWQALAPGDTPAPIDHMLNPVHQRIAWFKDYPIFVTQPLTNTVDPISNTAIRQGAGNVLFVPPEDGDVFVAPLENNTLYVFRVTGSNPVTASSDIHNIIYQAVSRLDDMPAFLDDISHKVYEKDVYAFNLNRWLAGQNPLTTAEALAVENSLSTIATQLHKDWDTFFDHDSSVYVATTNQGRIYDPYVNQVMSRILPPRYRRQCPRGLSYLWHREVDTYKLTCANSPYTALANHANLKAYHRVSTRARYGLSHLNHTSIEYLVSNGDGLAADSGVELNTFDNITVHADGYLTSTLYNTADPARSSVDMLIEAIHNNTVTPTLINTVYAEYTVLAHPNKYWVIPLLLLALEKTNG